MTLVLSGCVRTEVLEQSSSDVQRPPKKLLVCSLSTSADRGERIETGMVARLKKRRLDATTCKEWLGGDAGSDPSVLKSSAAAAGFDGVLVFQAENTADIQKTLNLPDGAWDRFLQGYRSALEKRSAAGEGEIGRLHDTFGRMRIIHAIVSLVDLQSDRTSWWTKGTLDGSAKRPLKDFIESALERTEDEMAAAGLFR
jgi:hypothetical protein